MIRCPECGFEYSYGRFPCHSCGSKEIFQGDIFYNCRKNYTWNCLTLDLKSIKKYSSNKDSIDHLCTDWLISRKDYAWNCKSNSNISKPPIHLSKTSVSFIYE
ncbi:MAG: hypothetical protein ACTSRH_11110 [Promethearchaeota archaeon]